MSIISEFTDLMHKKTTIKVTFNDGTGTLESFKGTVDSVDPQGVSLSQANTYLGRYVSFDKIILFSTYVDASDFKSRG